MGQIEEAIQMELSAGILNMHLDTCYQTTNQFDNCLGTGILSNSSYNWNLYNIVEISRKAFASMLLSNKIVWLVSKPGFPVSYGSRNPQALVLPPLGLEYYNSALGFFNYTYTSKTVCNYPLECYDKQP